MFALDWRDFGLAVFHENQVERFGQQVLNVAPLLGRYHLELRPHVLGKKRGDLYGSLSRGRPCVRDL